MAEKPQPKARFSTRMPTGDYLGLTIWPGKSDPTAEVLTVQVRRPATQGWETVARLAVYRTADGGYSQLPERTLPQAGTSKPEPTDPTQPSESSKDQRPSESST
jgi:hypothetical protein